jgi:hypothetical protein
MVVGVIFAHDLLKDMPLALTTKLLKSLSRHIVPSLEILCALSILVNGTKVHLNFYIFDVMEFDQLIGQPIERLIHEGKKGKLNIRLGKNFELSMPLTHSLHAKIEPIASLNDLIEPNLEDDAQFFIDEEEDEGSIDPEPLDELLEPPKPSIELKPLPSGLRYAFLNNDQDSPVIISDKLSQEESLCLLTVLEKPHSAFGYSSKTLRESALLFAPIVSLQIQILYLLGSPNVGLIMR